MPTILHERHTDTAASTAWVSQTGVAWALDNAECKPSLRLTLTVIARAADVHGRGSRQSVATIAEKVGKSGSQIKRDIAALVKAGLLVPGDQTAVSHIPAGRRPVVYDLAIPSSAAPTVDEKQAQPAPKQNTELSTGVAPMQPQRAHPCDVRGSTHAPLIIREEEENKTLSPSKPTTTVFAVPEREQIKETTHKTTESLSIPESTLSRLGIPTIDRQRLIADITKTHNVRSDGWWITAATNGTLSQQINDLRSRVKRQQTSEQFQQDLAKSPECPHGLPGGDIPRPRFGTPTCPQCRSIAALV